MRNFASSVFLRSAGIFPTICMAVYNSSVYTTEKEYKVSVSLHTAGAALCLFIVFVIGVASLIDWQKAWQERVERRLADDLWRFPKSYRALLKDCGVFSADKKVQKYLKEIIKGYEDSRILLRTRQVDRASKRFAYVQLCFHKARQSAQEAACRSATAALF